MSETTNNKINDRAIYLKWTWYIFLAANVLLMFCVALAWILCRNGVTNYYLLIPTTIGCTISIILLIIFYYFDAKNLELIKMHVKRNRWWLYIMPGVIFVIVVLFILSYTTIWVNLVWNSEPDKKRDMIFFIVLISVTGLLTLISIGLYRYARLKIDLDILKRRKGEQQNSDKSDSPAMPQDVANSLPPPNNGDQK